MIITIGNSLRSTIPSLPTMMLNYLYIYVQALHSACEDVGVEFSSHDSRDNSYESHGMEKEVKQEMITTVN